MRVNANESIKLRRDTSLGNKLKLPKLVGMQSEVFFH